MKARGQDSRGKTGDAQETGGDREQGNDPAGAHPAIFQRQLALGFWLLTKQGVLLVLFGKIRRHWSERGKQSLDPGVSRKRVSVLGPKDIRR